MKQVGAIPVDEQPMRVQLIVGVSGNVRTAVEQDHLPASFRQLPRRHAARKARAYHQNIN
jgi:hypothetical protein